MTDKSGKKCGFEPCNYNVNQTYCSPAAEDVDPLRDDTCSDFVNDDTLQKCVDQKTCFSNYHSCADIVIKGSGNRKEYNCLQPEKWEYRELPAQKYFGNESAPWIVLDAETTLTSDDPFTFFLDSKISVVHVIL